MPRPKRPLIRSSGPIKKTVFILSVSSDIGTHLAEKYLRRGFTVVGTYRTKTNVQDLQGLPNCVLFKCDLGKRADLDRFVRQIRNKRLRWDVLISCAGHPLPVMPFFDCDFDEWAGSVGVNAIGQLRALHMLYPYRNRKKADVVFFAGGGMNGSVVNFSAYTISKIMLAKMCEFLDAENKDLSVFIVGPGWTRTKIHKTILSDKRTAESKASETRDFLKNKNGTSLDDIYECIDWLCEQGKPMAGGRNFSVVYDPWRKDKREKLKKALKSDPDMYKLRRSKNEFR